MRRLLTGIRGQVTMAVLAVTAVAYSLLGTLGFLQIANSGRDAIEERIENVLDQTEATIAAGVPTVGLTTADGVTVSIVPASQTRDEGPGEVRIERPVTIDGVDLVLIGTSSDARLTDSLRSLYRGLWIGIPLAAVMSALLAGAATRRALRPVDDITRLAASVGASPGSVRVPVPDTDDEIDRLAITVNEMLDRIEHGRATQRRFTSDAAHELRTPLMALQGELELLDGDPGRVDGDILKRLGLLTARLGARIDDLVLLSTLDEARPLVLTRVDLADVVASEAETACPDAELVTSPTPVDVDRVLVACAVRNALSNARRHARARVVATVVVEGGDAVVHVDDDGPGVPVEHRSTLFERFARLDDARSTDTGGSGLGLAIVASVLGAHGGSVAFQDSPLGGARLTLRLPTTRDEGP